MKWNQKHWGSLFYFTFSLLVFFGRWRRSVDTEDAPKWQSEFGKTKGTWALRDSQHFPAGRQLVKEGASCDRCTVLSLTWQSQGFPQQSVVWASSSSLFTWEEHAMRGRRCNRSEGWHWSEDSYGFCHTLKWQLCWFYKQQFHFAIMECGDKIQYILYSKITWRSFILTKKMMSLASGNNVSTTRNSLNDGLVGHIKTLLII